MHLLHRRSVGDGEGEVLVEVAVEDVVVVRFARAERVLGPMLFRLFGCKHTTRNTVCNRRAYSMVVYVEARGQV